MKIKFDKDTLCYYLDSFENGKFTKIFASEEIKPLQNVTPSNSFPTQTPKLDLGIELKSFSEKLKDVPF
jgi:hypothetical protein